MPKVSVIIPCYNHGQYLDEAVDSVLAQSYQDFEIIIVNDGSTDEFTNKLLATYDKPKTIVLDQLNQGLPGARNSGIRVSSGEYILCLDADDLINYEFLEKTVPVLDADTAHEHGFVVPWAKFFGILNGIWETAEYAPHLLAMQSGIPASSLYRRECWEALGGYKEHMTSGYEDWDFWISITALGYKWVTVKEPLFYYRKRADSMLAKCTENRYQLFRQLIRNNEEYYRNNYEDIIVKGLENYETKIRKCEANQSDIQQVKNNLINCKNEMQVKIDDLIKSTESFRSSLSWKITAPIRAIFDLFRRR